MTLARQVTSQWTMATLMVALRGSAMERRFFHRPVLVHEVVGLLGIQPRGTYIDATVGEGGHASAILQAAMPDGRLLGLDLDPQALEAAHIRLAQWQGSFTLAHDSYNQLGEAAVTHGFSSPDAILLDLGLSSYQLEGSSRGFTFQRDEPLDMRFDPESELTAGHIVNSYPVEELAHLIRLYGGEPGAWAIARAIAQRRPLNTTRQLADLVEAVAGGRRRIHPATGTFQALRIATNGELDNLEVGLRQALLLLGPGARLGVISYHSLEDRIVKQIFAREAKDCLCPPRIPTCTCGHVATIQVVTRRPVRPSLEEVKANPRSRSGRLRVAQSLQESRRGNSVNFGER